MNTPDFQDYHTILYGHNMKNLSMFGSLKKYKTEDFYKDHQFLRSIHQSVRIVIRFLPIMMCRRRTKFTRLALPG